MYHYLAMYQGADGKILSPIADMIEWPVPIHVGDVISAAEFSHGEYQRSAVEWRVVGVFHVMDFKNREKHIIDKGMTHLYLQKLF